MPEQNNTFIIAAFVVTWLGIAGYALHLRRTRVDAERRMAAARQAVGGAA